MCCWVGNGVFLVLKVPNGSCQVEILANSSINNIASSLLNSLVLNFHVGFVVLR